MPANTGRLIEESPDHVIMAIKAALAAAGGEGVIKTPLTDAMQTRMFKERDKLPSVSLLTAYELSQQHLQEAIAHAQDLERRITTNWKT